MNIEEELMEYTGLNVTIGQGQPQDLEEGLEVEAKENIDIEEIIEDLKDMEENVEEPRQETETASKQFNVFENLFNLAKRKAVEVKENIEEKAKSAATDVISKKVPELGLYLMELHNSKLRDPAKQWFKQKMTELQPQLARIPEYMLQRSVEDTKKVFQFVRNLPETSVQQLVVGTSFKLLQELGDKNNRYESDKYSIFIEKAKTLVIADEFGYRLVEAEMKRFGLPEVKRFDLSAFDKANFIAVANVLGSDLLLKGDKLSQIKGMSEQDIQGYLGPLAPQGTYKSLSKGYNLELYFQAMKVLNVEASSMSSSYKSDKVELQILNDEYTIQQQDSKISILNRDKEEIFRAQSGTVVNMMTGYDALRIREALESMMKAYEGKTVEKQTVVESKAEVKTSPTRRLPESKAKNLESER